MEQTSPIIGIDLGTTNSVVSILENNTPLILPNSEGSYKTPSVVTFLPNGEIVVGDIAKRQSTISPQNTIHSVKRLMGRFYSEIENELKYLSYECTYSENDDLYIAIGNDLYTPQQISAMVLKKLKEAAELHYGKEINQAIITCPAYFDDAQRQATKEAGQIAGLNVIRLINEPTAAALAYGLGKGVTETVAVYDFGGGTLDITLLEIEEGTFEVLTSSGDTHLGGKDIDLLIVQLILKEIFDKHKIDLSNDFVVFRRLEESAEKAKCELSATTKTNINLPFLYSVDKTPIHYERVLTRKELEDMMGPIVEKTLECCEKALEDACLSVDKIDKVILVGGSTRIPLVQDMITEFFDQDPCKSVNPDEIVAMGAAVQGGVLTGAIQEIVLLDVTPFSLGVETKGDKMTAIITKDTTIPVKATKTFTTTEDGQVIVNIHILQGESEKASECMSLGKFSLTDIPSTKAGKPRISVTFSINADGLFEITAEELGSGIKRQLSIVHTFKIDDKSDSSAPSSKKLRRRKRRVKREVISQIQHSEDALKPVAKKIETTETKRKTPTTEGVVTSRKTYDTSKTDKLAADNYAMFSAPYEELLSSLKTDEERADESTYRTESPSPLAAETPVAESSLKKADTEIDSFPKYLTEEVQKDEEIELPGTPATPETTKVIDQKSFEEKKEDELPHDKISSKIGENEYEILERADSFLSQNRSDRIAFIWFDKAIEVLIKFIGIYPDKIDNYKKLFDLFLAKKQPEEAKNQLDKIYQIDPNQSELLIQKYNQLLIEFPNYLVARLALLHIFESLKKYDAAIKELELIVSKHPDKNEFEDKLVNIYKAKNGIEPDPATEFKLVKIYVKKQQLDEAITVLERLTTVPQYSLRANKILGLCYWQKNMLNLAWQKFSELPLTDEIKDLIFRLAEAMEKEGQLQNAREALEKITREDANYKNISTKIKKIDYRLKLSIEEIEKMKGKYDTRESRKEKKERKRFVIIEEINRGSMGIVYKAKDNALDEIVAIKVLNEALNSDPIAIDRFKREARAARRLSHPNIVRIHDLGENKGKKFISMEYIEGKDLKKIIRTEGKTPNERFIHYIKQICEALHYAHSLGIIHRDIKPANIIITENNRIKIADFGIAKITQTADATRLGVVMGTPLYMPPEQIEGKPTDGRSDIYSLGIVMYEMLTGSPPFTEGNIDYHHIHSKPPKMVDVNPRLEEIVMKCIEKNPDNRYQSAKELLDDLEKV